MTTIRVYNRLKKKLFSVNSNVGRLGGRVSSLCTKCDAQLFDGEGFICCADGKVKLRPLHPPTDEMREMFGGARPSSKEFLKKIRSYNSRFALNS